MIPFSPEELLVAAKVRELAVGLRMAAITAARDLAKKETPSTWDDAAWRKENPLSAFISPAYKAILDTASEIRAMQP